MDPEKHTMRRLTYIWPYVLFGVTIVLLIILNERTIRNEVNKNLDYAHIIELAGNQRVLAERITGLCAQDVTGVDSKKDIVTLTAQWHDTQAELQSVAYGIGKHADDHPEMAATLAAIAPIHKDLYQHLNIAGGRQIEPTLFTTIRKQADEYSRRMDLLSRQISQAAVADLEKTNTRQALVALLSGIILLLEIMIFIVPYHRRQVKAYKKMKEQQVQLEYDEFLLEESGRTAKVGGWDYDLATGQMNWTEAMYDIHETPRSEGNKTPMEDRINAYAPEDRTHITDKITKAMTAGEPFDLEARLITRKGNRKWIRSIATPVVNAQGVVERVRGVYLDITQHKMRELELLSIKEKLADTNKTKDTLFTIIAHDLRGPIVNLKSLITMKQEDIITKDEFMHYIEDVQRNISYLSDMMDNMLHWAQSQLKGFTVNRKVVNVNDVLNETAMLYQTALGYKNIDLQIQGNTYPLAYADHDHVTLIVRNLLTNAIKYTPQNGAIEIYLSNGNGSLTLHVIDSGSGIKPETLQKLERHEAIDSMRGTEGEKGTGLGLSFCIDLAAKNDGVLAILSTNEKGTHISLALPKYEKHNEG